MMKIGKGVEAFSASWSFRQMVNWHGIRACNEVNCQNGFGAIDICAPEEIVHD